MKRDVLCDDGREGVMEGKWEIWKRGDREEVWEGDRMGEG